MNNGTWIYVASKVRHAAMWRDLRARGLPVCSTWIDQAEVGQTPDFTKLWRAIDREIGCEARRLLLYVEVADLDGLRGALIETGMALACGWPVAVVLLDLVGGSVPELEARRALGSWLAHPQVRLFGTLTDALAAWHVVLRP